MYHESRSNNISKIFIQLFDVIVCMTQIFILLASDEQLFIMKFLNNYLRRNIEF